MDIANLPNIGRANFTPTQGSWDGQRTPTHVQIDRSRVHGEDGTHSFLRKPCRAAVYVRGSLLPIRKRQEYPPPPYQPQFRMTLLQGRKQEIINEYQVHDTDTGSTDVQVAILTERISRLSEHLKSNEKDFGSRQGLLKMIGRRKRLLSYINQEDPNHYRALINRLGIRG